MVRLRPESDRRLAGCFLASDDSDLMTCQTLLVEGGGSMW
jgi:hypothetical protein